MSELLFDVQESVALLTLNRPEHKNAFTTSMLDAWSEALLRCRDDERIRALVLTGAGDAFCAGGDVGRMKDNADAGVETPLDQKDYIWKNIARIPRLLQEIDKPFIAAVNGVAAGAGMDMALMADIIFAARSARMGETYIRVGLIPGDGGAWLLPRIVGMSKALELLWTGDMIDAEEALRIGLVNRLFEDERLLDETLAFASRLARGPSVAIRMTKRLCRQGLQTGLIEHLDLATSHQPVLKGTADHKEAVAAFKEKRKPEFRGR